MGTYEAAADTENHAELVRCIKCQVKAIMEEAVTKKFVHEQSAHVIRLCGTITSCLVNKLKKRHSGFMKTNKIANLFNNVGKTIPAVAELVTKIEEAMEANVQKRRQSESSNIDVNSQTSKMKFFWVRMALTEKLLDKILEVKFYEKTAILADPVYGPLIASLIVGPCALDYTKMKTTDHYWSDPPADELMQRHKLHSRHATPASPARGRPTLHTRFLSAETTSVDKILRNENNIAASSFRDYVESLHQNSKSTLLYGKNNVKLQPKDDNGPISGYLSLHQSMDSLLIKWTPNQLMNGTINNNIEHTDVNKHHDGDANRSYWKYIMSINIAEVVYLHCHQQQDKSGTVVFVGQDGVQHSPISFPPGGHLLAFLTCLEAGLLPRGHLDPPLRSQRGKGKVFPRLNEGSTSSSGSQVSQSDVEEPTDFVFRVTLGNDEQATNTATVEVYNQPDHEFTFQGTDGSDVNTARNRHAYAMQYANSSSLKTLCDTMRRQIISRAFYGWLGYSRHLSSVRTHLSALVNDEIAQPNQPTDAMYGINQKSWEQLKMDGKITSKYEMMRHVYFGGISHDLRNEVWPFLLGYYPIESIESDREKIDMDTKSDYEEIMTEWLAVEVIVKQRETEAFNLAKLSTGGTGSTSSTSSYDYYNRKQSTATVNEVFASLDRDSEDLDEKHDVAPTDKFTLKDEVKQSNNNKKRRLQRKGSHEDHVPYSSISTADSLTSGVVSTDLSSSANGDMRRLSLNNSLANYKRNMDKQLHKQAIVESVDEANIASDVENEDEGSTYDAELLDDFGLNLHRIEKDVHRCDRNHSYFAQEGNLDKLRNVMCSYVWKNLKTGYMQGMCDIAAPLLILFDDESKVHSCFKLLMERMGPNFPHGGAMDKHLANVRSLLQILDSELYEHMHQNGDYTHFYFCYRWFLLDFKRELSYDEDVFAVWERIWAAKHCSTEHFSIFFGMAMLHNYRDIILNNDMDFTDIIKFFNEMAERHDAKQIVKIAQKFVSEVQQLIHK